VAAALAAGLIAGCGGSGGTPRHSVPRVRVLMASGPDSLDPAVGGNSEALQADWLAYTPLLTYIHSTGAPGTGLIPALASDWPTITDDGRTYTFVLRTGLVYSDGQAVRAGDFAWALERAVRLGSPDVRRFITERIVGASAFAAGRARTISGLSTDDASGRITIRLTAPDGSFENILALPALAPVPRSTPMRAEPAAPPPGLGPYEIRAVVPGRSFALVKNPRWRRGQIPGIPAGRVDTDATITHDPAGNALAVLNNSADAFDSADAIPPRLLGRIALGAGTRYQKEATGASYLIFLNVTRRPFSNQLARRAVQRALDANLLKLMDPGGLQEGCFLIPPSIYGHPHDQCPGGDIFAGGDVAGGRALVKESRTSGTRVTVWSEASSPARQWMGYYVSLLRRLGFRAALHFVPDARYASALAAASPQTGFSVVSAGVPNPAEIYQWVTGDAGDRPRRGNWGQIDDPYVNTQVKTLAPVPAGNLSAVSSFWRAVDRYVANRAYVAVFGYPTQPRFVSARIDLRALVFSPVVGLDWSSFQLK
jgi:peptide/nickel transport system substrate-binding protein